MSNKITNAELLKLLTERFPWLTNPDDSDVSGADVVDELAAWFEELQS